MERKGSQFSFWGFCILVLHLVACRFAVGSSLPCHTSFAGVDFNHYAVGAFLVWTFLFCWIKWFVKVSGLVLSLAHRVQSWHSNTIRKRSKDAGLNFDPQLHRVEVGTSRGFKQTALRLSWAHWMCFMMMCCRVGEASHPGPLEAGHSQWSIGLCNPSGINNKMSQINQLDGEAWFICETHLSQHGVSRFRHGLKASRSEFKYFVHGAPCVARSASAIGGYSGVGVLSRVPMRALPHSFCQGSFGSARLQVVGLLIQGWWVQAGVLYGYPDSQQFLERSFQTDCLLHELVERIAVQGHGPRLICGDFNHSSSDLQNCSRLQQLGFCEAQTFALYRWGIPIQSTSKGAFPIDQVWLSAELQQLLVQVEIRDCEWADHASVVCHFSSSFNALRSFHWKMPHQLQWPEMWDVCPQVDWTDDSSLAYASFWHQVETAAQGHCDVIPKGSRGRGQTLESQITFKLVPPCKNAREGDFQPQYHGPSIKYLQWVKQLRRCQSLSRLLHSTSDHEVQRIRLAEVWAAIRRASGFPGGFCAWLTKVAPNHPFAIAGFPLAVPSQHDASSLVEDMKSQVSSLERELVKGRIQSAKQRRCNNLQLLFQDCAKEQPSKVDTLVQTVEVGIDEVRSDDCSVVLQRPVPLQDTLPVVIQGQVREVMASCEDQVWLSSIDSIAPGDVLRQDKVSFTDGDILARFEEVWHARWNKLSHLTSDNWKRVRDFIQSKFVPIKWTFPDWSVEVFCNAVRNKKKASATGPDGVSRDDLLSLPQGACQQIVNLFETLESSQCPWPAQLVTGFVTSLNKEKGDGGVDTYRPVTIFPLVYRIWSTIRARHSMASLAVVLPDAVRGGIPARQAGSIWYEMAQRLEAATIGDCSLQGICLDICKAFNALPREPLWIALRQLDFPYHILWPWAAFLAQAKRRFKVRSSTGAPIGSCVGFPEGCALSVFSMAVLDWVVSAWVESLTPEPTNFISYVDDWQVLFSNVDQFQVTWEAVNHVVSALDLQLDQEKSFVWAALCRDRSKLGLSPIACKLAARDLGAHQNFCKKAGNRTLTDRIRAMASVWRLFRTCHSPFRLKSIALLQLAWPKALHGVSIVKVGCSHFVSLRTGAARGLRASQVGSNPLLLLTSIGIAHDPEAWAILQTFKDAFVISLKVFLVMDQLLLSLIELPGLDGMSMVMVW